MNRLKNLDLKEVSAKTQIEIAFLEALVQKDFKNLEKFNVRGFLKILSREYEIDCSEFLQEYENFLNEEGQTQPEKNEKKSNKESQITTQVEVYVPPQKSKAWLVILVIIIVAFGAWLVYQYDLLRYINTGKKESSSSAVLIEEINQAQDNIRNSNTQEMLSQDDENQTQMAEVNESKEIQNALENRQGSQAEENNATQENIKDADKNNTQSLTPNTNINDRINELNTQTSLRDEAIFNSKGKVWVGFVNLKTGRKEPRPMVIDGNFSVNLNEDQLLLIGATALLLVDEEGKMQEFPAGESKRFLVQNKRIKPITLGEFKALNKGREW